MALQNEKQLPTDRRGLPLALKLLIVLGGLALVACALFTVRFFRRSGGFQFDDARVVSSDSMCPTICEKESVMVDSTAYVSTPIARGDVVLFVHGDPPVEFVKRVVGIAGDTVSSKEDGTLLVNGASIPPLPPVCGSPAYRKPEEAIQPFNTYVVPVGYVFVLGDNPSHSLDSRAYGGVNVADVRGKPVTIYSSPGSARIGCQVR